MSALVLIVQPAHFWIQEATTRRPIVRYAVKANTLRRLEPQRQPLALTVWRANMQHNKGAMKRVTASSAASASTRRHLQPRQRQHARVVSRARHRLQAAMRKQTARTCVRQATRGSLDRARPATPGKGLGAPQNDLNADAGAQERKARSLGGRCCSQTRSNILTPSSAPATGHAAAARPLATGR